MHSAPSVTYPAGRSRFAGALLLGAWLSGCAAAVVWGSQSPGVWRLLAMVVALAVAGAFATWHWWRSPGGTLAWDGEAWHWSIQADAPAPFVEVALDFQRALLLRWVAGRSSHWLWLDRAGRPECWDDLRRAVYSRARPPALHQALPPAAKP